MVVYFNEKIPRGSEIAIKLHYATNTSGSAISWLTPAQTSSKTLPYLFSQCEPIYCRSIAPLQDTPAIRATYTAKLVFDKRFSAYMSANLTSSTSYNDTHFLNSYSMDIPIPSYLLAIAVGNLTE